MKTQTRLSLTLLSSAALGLTTACTLPNDSGEPAGRSTSLAIASGSPITSGISGKCLDDSSDLTANFNKIQIWQCNGTGAQAWTYSGGNFVGPGGKCLDIHSDVQAPGTVVDLYQCNGTAAQKWSVDGTAIKSTNGLCLDVKNGVNANGTQVQLWSCNGTTSQEWHVSGATGGNAPCTFDGKTVASGSNVTPNPFKNATVPYGQTCTTETVSCSNGVLSPANASPTCVVLPRPSAPSLRQYGVEQTNGGSGVWEVNSVKQFPMATQKGNAIWVAATIPNDGAQKSVTVSDTQGNDFVALDFEQDNSKGTQSVWQFYAGDIKGDGGEPDTITVHWGTDNYKGVLIAEIAGVSSSPLVGHHGNIQDYDAPPGNNTVTSGTISVGSTQTPALLLAVSMDTFGGTSDTGGDGYPGPIYGNGFSGKDYIWDWDPGAHCTGGLACNLAAFETLSITEAGTTAGLFTARAPSNVSDPGSYVTLAAVFH